MAKWISFNRDGRVDDGWIEFMFVYLLLFVWFVT